MLQALCPKATVVPLLLTRLPLRGMGQTSPQSDERGAGEG
jgi:hypothetical protein